MSEEQAELQHERETKEEGDPCEKHAGKGMQKSYTVKCVFARVSPDQCLNENVLVYNKISYIVLIFRPTW